MITTVVDRSEGVRGVKTAMIMKIRPLPGPCLHDHEKVWVRRPGAEVRLADEGEGRAGVVEEAMVAGGGGERLTSGGDPGPRPVRPGQRGALRVDGDQLTIAPEQHRPVPPGGDRHSPGAEPFEHRGRVRRLTF